MRAALVLFLIACGGASKPAASPKRENDPHRALDAEECAAVFDFLAQKRWLPDPDATSEEVVKSCVEMKATKAYSDCILGSGTREEAERCQ